MFSLNLDPSVVGRDRTLTVRTDVGLTQDDVKTLCSDLGADHEVPFLAAPVDTDVPELRAVMFVVPDGIVHFQVSEDRPAKPAEEAHEGELTDQAATLKPVDSTALMGAVTSAARRSRLQFHCSARAEFVRAEYKPLVNLPLDLWAPGSFALGAMVGARFRYPALREAWVALDSSRDESRFTTQIDFVWRGALTAGSLEKLWSLAFSHLNRVVAKVSEDSPPDSEAN